MINKNKKLEIKELYNLSTEFKDEFFPRRIQNKNRILGVYKGDVIIAYVCLDHQSDTQVVLHLHIPKVTHKTFRYLQENFYSVLHPYLKTLGYKYVCVSCLVSDKKITRLLELFNFNLVQLNVGIMEVKE